MGKRKNIGKGLVLCTFIMMLGMQPIICQAKTILSEETTVENIISPRADDIKWRYKEGADGKFYKRLYNYTTNSWVGDWIEV